MVHRGVLSCGGTEFGGPCHFTGEAPRFQAVRESGWLTQATSRSKTKGIRPKLAALARSHPIETGRPRLGGIEPRSLANRTSPVHLMRPSLLLDLRVSLDEHHRVA